MTYIGKQREKLIKRDGLLCALCRLPIISEQQATVDHDIPRSKGGRSNLRNLQLAHKSCNGRKSNKTWHAPTKQLTPAQWQH